MLHRLVVSVALLPIGVLMAQVPRLAEVGEALPDGLGQVFASIDFEGDGDVDLISTTGVFLNERGYFVRGPVLPASFVAHFNVRSIAARDFTGDGRVDVLVGRLGGSPSGLAMFVAPAAGGGAFLAQPTAIGGFTGVHEFAVADFDNDGDYDVIAASSSTVNQNWVLLWNDGAGGFSAASAQQWPGPLTAASWLDTGDFDGDGLVDVFAATATSGLIWRRNGGGGLFGNSQPLPSLLNGVESGVVGDFDGDGFDDLVLVDGTGNDQRLRGGPLGPGGAMVIAGGIVGAPMLAADLDGDGRDEILRSDVPSSGAIDGYLTLLPGTPAGVGAPIPISTVTYAYGSVTPYAGLAVCDVDGDGDQDLAVAPGGQAPWLVLGTAGGVVVLADKNVPVGFQRPFAPPHDVDGDGDVDLITASLDVTAAVRLVTYRNDGRGVMTVGPKPAGAYYGLTIGSGRWADLDVDGDADLLVLSPIGPHLVLLNNGAGVFTLGAMIHNVGPATTAAIGDFDGDQLVDLIIARAPILGFPVIPQQPVLLRALPMPGGVAYASPVPFAFAAQLSDLEVFDLGGDGDLDLLLAAGVSGSPFICENDGTGAFTALPPFVGPVATSVAVGDLNSDTNLDLVLGNQTWLGQGGVFVPFASHAAPIGELSLADVDGDGDLDLFDSAGAVYLGSGNGSFGPAEVYVPYGRLPLTAATGLGAPVDVDADGDLDVVLPTRGAPSHFTVHSNLTRQVARTGLAQAGAPLGIAVYGQPGEGWFLAASFAAPGGGIALPPLGTLWLDPATLVVIAGGFTPIGGRSDVSLPLPLTAGGVTLTWQALVGASFSNATDTLILP